VKVRKREVNVDRSSAETDSGSQPFGVGPKDRQFVVGGLPVGKKQTQAKKGGSLTLQSGFGMTAALACCRVECVVVIGVVARRRPYE